MQSIKLFFSLHSILLSSTVHCTKLFCTVIMYRVLHCNKLHSLTVLHCIDCFFSFTLVYTVLYFHPLCTALNCTWPFIHSFALLCTVLCSVLLCAVLQCRIYTVLNCTWPRPLTVLHCICCFFLSLVYTVLYLYPLCTALNCTWPLIHLFALFCKLCYALFCYVLFYSVESTLH